MSLYQRKLQFTNWISKKTLVIIKLITYLVLIAFGLYFVDKFAYYFTIITKHYKNYGDWNLFVGTILGFIIYYLLIYRQVKKTFITELSEEIQGRKKRQAQIKIGIKAEKELYNFLKQLTKKLKKYDKSVKLKKNIILKNEKTGQKFDVDFLIESKNKKILLIFECKGYTSFKINGNGEVITLYEGKETGKYNPFSQIQNTKDSLINSFPHYQEYKVYLFVAFPLARSYTISPYFSGKDVNVILPNNQSSMFTALEDIFNGWTTSYASSNTWITQ